MPSLADFALSFVAADRIPAHLTTYIPGKTLFSTWPAVVAMVLTYLVIVFGTREVMKDREPFQLTALFRAHNLVLSVGSLILVTLLGEEVLSNWRKPEIGVFGSLCASEAYTNRLEFYFMVNYYFKYYEFFDTVFLALKKKPLSFLHVYHHCTTAILAFVQLNIGPAPACWVIITINLGIHVLMYYYYYAAAGGVKIWWKKYLTKIQIFQFVVDLVIITFGAYQGGAYTYFPHTLPHMGNCAGTVPLVCAGAGCIFSYLILFLNFFYKTYPENGKTRTGNHTLTDGLRSAVHTHSKMDKKAMPESLLFSAR